LKEIADSNESLKNSFTSTHLSSTVGTISMTLPNSLRKSKIEEFLQDLLWEKEKILKMTNVSDKFEHSSLYEIWRLKV